MSESREREPRKLTEKDLEQFMKGDYPQNGPDYVVASLNTVETGFRTPQQFYEKIHPEWLMNFEEYIDKKLVKRDGYTKPDSLGSLQERADVIAKLIAQLKQELIDRKPLAEIYATVKRFETEAGFPIREVHLPVGV